MSSDSQPAPVIANPLRSDVKEPFSTTMDIGPPRFPTLIDPSTISKLVNMKNHKFLRDHGGIEGVVSAFETDVEIGISGDQMDIDNRRRTFGSNLYPEKHLFKCFCHSPVKALKDPLIVILAVLISLTRHFSYIIRVSALQIFVAKGVDKEIMDF